jgi:phosphoserine phosphatase RsbU/P
MHTENAPCILCIEDDALVRNSIVAYLEDSHYRVLEAVDGAEGLEITRQETPDLVLTDLQMPGIGGLEVLKSIRQLYPKMPIIVVSGAGALQDAVEALRLGAWDYLIKPIAELGTLEFAIKKALEKARLIAENHKYRVALEEHFRLLQEDQEAGRHVQEQLLPLSTTRFGAYTVSFIWSPSFYLSGDFVDYFVMDNRYLIVYMADVSGHGAASAFITILLKHLVRSMEPEHLLNPHLLLERLNRTLYNEKLGKYLTMVYTVIDMEQHHMRYAVAGHFPAPMKGEGERLEPLNGRGHAIGICPEPTFEILDCDFPNQDRYILCSDGVLELMRGKTMTEKQEALLAGLRTVPWQEKELRDWMGSPSSSLPHFPDDLSLIWVQRWR